MKKFLMFLCAVMFVFGMVGSASALDFDFSGTFTKDNDITLLNFTVGSDSTITIFSSSWGNDIGPRGYVAGGGFDPILAIWDDTGGYVNEQDDGGNVGSTLSNGVSYTHGCWDSYYDIFLAAGDYTASIGQYDNFANGSNLSDGFYHDGDPTFTQAFASNPHTYFNGVWDDNDYRTGDWAFHLLNVEEASQQPVPEPCTILLMGAGLLGLVVSNRKRFSKKS